MKKWIGSLLLVFVIAGCATQGLHGTFVEKKHTGGSLEGMIKAFDRVTLGVRGRSANGREIVSRYQNPKGDNFESAATKKERGYARLLILGDRRPYDIQLQFVLEEDVGGGEYQTQGYDDEKARKILKKLLDTLASRPDNKDFIDDFRPY